ncbi:glycosyltransferase family 39 protein [Brachyspira sp. SAP_772]|uniref:glycosyltransferase family 39 protein n=1 Tax=Brachyspira sp. SAP_772 TaxID=2608385 RepID=UPI0012F4BF2F|nr:glycosyltransferase family 39 protein [Brachyspira sp. SAP_772]
MKKNINIYIAFIIPIILTIIIHIYAFPFPKAYLDEFKQYDDMRNFYDNKIFPTLGTKMTNAALEHTPRMPGGFYYILYSFLYKISNENDTLLRLLFMILCMIVLFLFICWTYKRFGKYTAAILSALLLCNAYLFFASIDIYNPNVVIYLSFIFMILFYEYVIDGKYSYISALLMFPIIALMAQCHFTLFFSMVPSLIVYHIIRFKKLTKKYIIPILISVFISFLIYLPYLIAEIKNGFLNTSLMLSMRGSSIFIGLPQIYAMILFPTTEISIFYGRSSAISYFWLHNNRLIIFEALILIISTLLSVYAIFFSIRKLVLNKYKENITSDTIMKEGIILYLLYIPVTLLTFFILKSYPGTFHYIYSAFALSFIPIITLIKYIENKNINLKNALIIFSILFSISSSFHIIRTVNIFIAPFTYKNQKELVSAIVNDSKGESFYIDTVRDKNDKELLYALAANRYGFKDKWNIDTNSKLVYFIYDRNMYFHNSKWNDVKDGKNKLIPENAIKIWGDDALAVYRYIKN